MNMFAVTAGWLPQLTNEHREFLFIDECSPVKKRISRLDIKAINTSVYILQPNRGFFTTKGVAIRHTYERTPCLAQSFTEHISRGDNVITFN